MNESNLWNYVSIEDYKIPEKSMDESIKSVFHSIKNALFQPKINSEQFQASDNLINFPKTRLMRIVPNPDWHQWINALSNLFSTETNSNVITENVVFLISIPYSSHSEVVEKWSQKMKYPIIPIPDKEDIINHYNTWCEDLSSKIADTNVILNLERYMYNDHFGLSLFRTLFTLISNSTSKWIIELNSWFWALLQSNNFIPISLKYQAFIPQAFSKDELKIWLQNLTTRSRFYKFAFRRTNDGHYLIHPQEEEIIASGNPDKLEFDDKFFRNLCNFTIGIPNIALYYWRYNLRVLPEEDFLKQEENGDTELNEKTSLYRGVIWILPWDKIPKPIIPTKLLTEEEAILWNVIIHGGLNFDILEIVMGSTVANPEAIISKLVKSDILIVENKRIDINPPVFPFVAKLLNQEGYLTDGLVY